MTENGDERELPDVWSWATVGEVGDVSGGLTKNRKRSSHRLKLPYLRVANVYANELQLDKIKEIGVDEGELDRVLLKKGDLLVVEGNGSIDQIGRVARWSGVISPCVHQNHLIKVRSSCTVEEKYILYWLLSPGGRERIVRVSSSTSGLHTLSLSKVRAIPVPIAPLAEQRRIVDTIEELFSDLDAGVQALETVRRQLDRYRQSVLKAAVEGDLTAAWREQHGADAEPADALLDRILEERRARWETDYAAKYEAKGKTPPKGWKDRYKDPEPSDIADLPDLPDGWARSSFDAMLSEGLRNGKSAKTAEKGVRVLTLSAVTDGDFSKANTKIADLEEATVEDLWLTEGDLLIERSNTPELVGTTRLYKGPDNFAVFPDLVIRARTSSLVIDRYAEIVLQSHAARTYFMSKARGTSGSMQKINQSTIQAFPFPLAPLAEQEAIVEEVEQRLSVVDAVSSDVDAQLARAGQLRRAILKHAFEGRLVPQKGEPENIASGEGKGSRTRPQDAQLALGI